ncbi:MAG: hypothetical protein OXF06_04025, partial [Bacteroidetes bacterium]|nr:hypothetical protein [Bacteroidota bacterium]
HLGSRRLRLEDKGTNVETLGLCSGTLVLGEVETTQDGSTVQDSTLYITEKLVVQAGSFELDSSNPGRVDTDKDGYILEYKPSGEHTAGPEWFAPSAVIVSHKDAVVVVDESKTIAESVQISKGGHLHFKGDGSHLVIGKAGGSATATLMIDEGELHANGNNVQVYGDVTVGGGAKKAAKLTTDGGEFHVLGVNSDKGIYTSETAELTIGAMGTVDVGAGALQLGPEMTAKENNLREGFYNSYTGRKLVALVVTKGGKVSGDIRIPQGSKHTLIDGEPGSLGTIVFDGTATPKDDAKDANFDGALYIAADAPITIDSLSAKQGTVEFQEKKATIAKDVELSTANIWAHNNDVTFKKDLVISGTGGLHSPATGDATGKVMIEGDFMQKEGKKGTNAGVRLSGATVLTVMGDFHVEKKAFDFLGNVPANTFWQGWAVPEDKRTQLVLKGDIHYAKNMLDTEVEFSGKESQKVKSVATLGNVTVSNAKGIALDSTVTQSNMATLTLSRGVISGDHDWVVTNRTAERNLSNSVRATENGSIFRSSRLSYLATSLTRSVLSTGVDSSAYLFPAGAEKDGNNYYRPLILQLGSNEASDDSVTVTVSPETVPSGATPSWPAENIRVPASGETLTLDAYADIFWRVEVGDGDSDELLTSPSIRVQAHGINNVFDADRLRIVQWDCDWSDARLAGQYNDGENDEDSFAFNGYIGGNLNLTQTGIALGSCSILGIAANGIENPIHLSSGSTVQQSRVQFIHNAVLPSTVNLSLDGTSIATGVGFQSATGYLTTTAGSHTATIAPAGAPESQWINAEF